MLFLFQIQPNISPKIKKRERARDGSALCSFLRCNRRGGDKDVSDEAARTLDHPSPHPDGCLGIVLKKGSGLQPCFAFLTIPPKPSCICSSKPGWNTAKLPSLFSLGAESWYISETADKTGPVNTYNFYIQEHSRACSALLLYLSQKKTTKKKNGQSYYFFWVFFF